MPRALALVVVLLLGGGMAACGSSPKAPEPKTVATLHLAAEAGANPDTSGRGAPVVVRIYQLKTDGEFLRADFFPLFEQEQAALGTALVSRTEYLLAPGSQQDVQLPVAEETQFIAALAAFRDFRNARWRGIVPVPEHSVLNVLGKDRVEVTVSAAELRLAVAQ